jgi:hypothetical protein
VGEVEIWRDTYLAALNRSNIVQIKLLYNDDFYPCLELVHWFTEIKPPNLMHNRPTEVHKKAKVSSKSTVQSTPHQPIQHGKLCILLDLPTESLTHITSFCFPAPSVHRDSDETYRILLYLDLASRANSGQESAIDDFAREILQVLGYETRGLILRSRYAIPLLIFGETN